MQDGERTSLPEIIEVCKFQGCIPIYEELTVAFVMHVSLHSFCRVEGFTLLITPQADLPNANFLSWKKRMLEVYNLSANQL